jgi:hypothetical protein
MAGWVGRCGCRGRFLVGRPWLLPTSPRQGCVKEHAALVRELKPAGFCRGAEDSLFLVVIDDPASIVERPQLGHVHKPQEVGRGTSMRCKHEAEEQERQEHGDSWRDGRSPGANAGVHVTVNDTVAIRPLVTPFALTRCAPGVEVFGIVITAPNPPNALAWVSVR